MRLQGRTAVVTGGGQGIGEAVARALADAGAAVLVAGRSGETVERVANALRDSGARAYAAVCDVTLEASIAKLATRVRSDLGNVDILVNNAGAASSSPLHRLTLEEWDRLFAVNATSTFLCTRAFSPQMIEAGWGRIVNVASVAGLSGARYIAAYAAAKHAVIGFTRCVAAEAAGSGVTANAVCPGYVDTAMTRESIARIVEKTGMAESAALGAMLEATGQKRLIRPDEVAHAVLTLCDDAAGGVNGQAVVIDGGALLA